MVCWYGQIQVNCHHHNSGGGRGRGQGQGGRSGGIRNGTILLQQHHNGNKYNHTLVPG